jgi:hypothetical protein
MQQPADLKRKTLHIMGDKSSYHRNIERGIWDLDGDHLAWVGVLAPAPIGGITLAPRRQVALGLQPVVMEPQPGLEPSYADDTLLAILLWVREPHVQLVSKRWAGVWARATRLGAPPKASLALVGASIAHAELYLELAPSVRPHLCEAAAYAGCLETLWWARNRCEWGPRVCALAAARGHRAFLLGARKVGCPWDAWTCYEAARAGHFDLLRTIRHVYPPTEYAKWTDWTLCPWDSWTCAAAALNGYADILAYAVHQGCPLSPIVCAYAARGGHLSILKWLHAIGCAWDANVCTYAAQAGHFELLRWACENGCQWCIATCTAAYRSGHFEILDWLLDNGCPWCPELEQEYLTRERC